uniref:Uncharacterized protein n=1 Tax=Anguilla anguilla TaxID=7936 RepID=A0A0E9QYB9_ANGAN
MLLVPGGNCHNAPPTPDKCRL